MTNFTAVEKKRKEKEKNVSKKIVEVTNNNHNDPALNPISLIEYG